MRPQHEKKRDRLDKAQDGMVCAREQRVTVHAYWKS